MRRITVDANLHDAILELWQTTELCDSEGRVIGKFVPDLDAFLVRNGVDPIEFFADDELPASSQKSYTTAEVLARLKEWS